jgi:Holliday junction resolvase
VRKRLEALGFQVADIREHPTENRPDLRAAKQGLSMLVEVKARTEDADLRAKMESVRASSTESFLVSLDKHNSLF